MPARVHNTGFDSASPEDNSEYPNSSIDSSVELLGCFTDRQPLALKRPPQDPSVIKTQFHLYTREKQKEPDVLNYGDKLQSMNQSQFNGTKKLKVIIHGYKGSGNNEGAIAGVQAFLDLVSSSLDLSFRK